MRSCSCACVAACWKLMLICPLFFVDAFSLQGLWLFALQAGSFPFAMDRLKSKEGVASAAFGLLRFSLFLFWSMNWGLACFNLFGAVAGVVFGWFCFFVVESFREATKSEPNALKSTIPSKEFWAFEHFPFFKSFALKFSKSVMIFFQWSPGVTRSFLRCKISRKDFSAQVWLGNRCRGAEILLFSNRAEPVVRTSSFDSHPLQCDLHLHRCGVSWKRLSNSSVYGIRSKTILREKTGKEVEITVSKSRF